MGHSEETNMVQRQEGVRGSLVRKESRKVGTAALNRVVPVGTQGSLLSSALDSIYRLPTPGPQHIPEPTCHPNPGKLAVGVSQPTSS